MDSVLAALRRPEHTGENRCWPCTAVNVAVLCVIAAALWVVSSIAAVAAAALGLFLIRIRGYLIPGTPRFAPALVARLPGGETLFHGSSDRRSDSLGPGASADGPAGDADATESGQRDDDEPPGAPGGDVASEGAPEGDALLARLVDAGVLEADEERVAPTGAFEERWHAEMAELRDDSTEALADAALAVSPATESRAVRRDGAEWIALSDGADHALQESWLTRPIVIAEVAGARAAADFVDDETALAAAQTCRMFLEACPDCGTALERGTDASCCGAARSPDGAPSETLFCPACDARVYTFDEE